jgi:hypothetical protein
VHHHLRCRVDERVPFPACPAEDRGALVRRQRRRAQAAGGWRLLGARLRRVQQVTSPRRATSPTEGTAACPPFAPVCQGLLIVRAYTYPDPGARGDKLKTRNLCRGNYNIRSQCVQGSVGEVTILLQRHIRRTATSAYIHGFLSSDGVFGVW